MKSDLMLLGAVGAIIALVVAYAMMGQTQKTSVTTSKKRSFDQTVTDPEFGEAVLVAKDPDNKTDTRFVSTNAADFGEAVAQLAQGSVAEGAAAWGAKRIRSVASVADKGQYLLGISDEQRQKLEAAALQKRLKDTIFTAENEGGDET